MPMELGLKKMEPERAGRCCLQQWYSVLLAKSVGQKMLELVLLFQKAGPEKG